MHLDRCMAHLTCLATKENAWTKELCCGVSQPKSIGKWGDRARHYNIIYDLDLHSPITFSSPTKRHRSGWAASHDTLLVKIWENVFPFLASAPPQTSRSEASCTASHLSLSKLSSGFSAFASLPCSQPIVHRWAQSWCSSGINPQHTELDFTHSHVDCFTNLTANRSLSHILCSSHMIFEGESISMCFCPNKEGYAKSCEWLHQLCFMQGQLCEQS